MPGTGIGASIFSETSAKQIQSSPIIWSEESNCTICMTDFDHSEPVRMLLCGHTFHEVAMLQGLELSFIDLRLRVGYAAEALFRGVLCASRIVCLA